MFVARMTREVKTLAMRFLRNRLLMPILTNGFCCASSKRGGTLHVIELICANFLGKGRHISQFYVSPLTKTVQLGRRFTLV